MKKSLFLFALSFCFALPAFAQNTTQTSQTVKTIDTPAQVTVTINNTTTAQGNTQTTKVENSSTQPATITATASGTNPNAGQNTTSGSTSLFGNYASSPYQSNIQVEMLRNTVWGSLVPRKRLYDDPAKVNGPARSSGSRYASKHNNKKKSTKTASAQGSGTQTTNMQATTGQNPAANSSGQTITVVQKDGLLCVPLEQFEQITGLKPAQNAASSDTPAFYVPASNPAAGVSPVNGASPASGVNPASSASPVQAVTPANGPASSASSVNSPASAPEKDIFAIPANPFDLGSSPSPLGQNPARQNPVGQSSPQVSAGANNASGRDIGITPNVLGTQNK